MKDLIRGRSPLTVLAFGTGLLCMAEPAIANAGFTIPDPSNLALFAIGVLGLIIGRRGARRPPPD